MRFTARYFARQDYPGPTARAIPVRLKPDRPAIPVRFTARYFARQDYPGPSGPARTPAARRARASPPRAVVRCRRLRRCCCRRQERRGGGKPPVGRRRRAHDGRRRRRPVAAATPVRACPQAPSPPAATGRVSAHALLPRNRPEHAPPRWRTCGFFSA